MAQLSGKVAVVTGSAQGIGLAIARRLARDGADIVLIDLAPLDAARAAVEAEGRAVLGLGCDLADAAAVEAMADAALDWRGRCDALVNNAGAFPDSPWEDLDYARWRAVMAVNLDAPFLLARAFAPGMGAAGWGRIVNIASAVVNEVRKGASPYIASKMGLIGLTRALASELGAAGVTVNAVSPGLVPTEGVAGKFGGPEAAIFKAFEARRPIPRRLEPEHIAGAVAFLCSEDAAMMTGQTLIADGGLNRL